MGIFNFFKKSEQKPTAESPSTSSQWDSLKDVPFQERAEQTEQPAETIAERVKRQGDKIIAAYLYDPTMLINKSVTIDDEERSRALHDLESGAFSEEKQSQILQSIATPVGKSGQENYGPTLLKISGRQPTKILAFITMGAQAADAVKAEPTIDAESERRLKLLLKECPTPIEFAPHEEAMMTRLQEVGNSPAKLAQYEESFELFKEAVYGKRYEYYKALEVLKDSATKQALAEQNEADRPRREAELRQLQTPIIPSSEQIADNPYMSGEQRRFYEDANSDPNQE